LSLDHYIEELRERSQPLKQAGLVRLSGLLDTELQLFQAHWGSLPEDRRRQITASLVELAEDNVDLDFDAVFRACLLDQDAEVRTQAIAGLWECEDRTLILPLIKLLRADPAEQVRSAAATALGKFAILSEEGKALPRDGQRIEEALLTAIEDPKQPIEVRRRSIEAIATVHGPKISEIIAQAYRDGDPLLRCSAVFAMGKSGDPQWLPTILNELENSDPSMRFEAANACGEMGEPVAVPFLERLAHDDDPEIRQATIRALGAVGGRAAKQVLLSLLKSDDASLQDAAKEALEQFDVDRDLPSLKRSP